MWGRGARKGSWSSSFPLAFSHVGLVNPAHRGDGAQGYRVQEVGTMWRSCRIVVGVSLWLTVLLGSSDNALAQGPGYRLRVPAGSSFGARVRPPRLMGIPQRSLNPVVPGFGYRFFAPYSYFGFYPYGTGGYGYPEDSTADYPADSPADYSTGAEPAREVYPVDQSVPASVGRLQVSSEVHGSSTIVRLTWRDRGIGAEQVAFFLADSARRVLSAQTDRSPPFTALFDPAPGTAFAGMTVVLPNGALVTRFVGYRP
jgi:hypothetical protein